jgi:hypothetical protein
VVLKKPIINHSMCPGKEKNIIHKPHWKDCDHPSHAFYIDKDWPNCAICDYANEAEAEEKAKAKAEADADAAEAK